MNSKVKYVATMFIAVMAIAVMSFVSRASADGSSAVPSSGTVLAQDNYTDPAAQLFPSGFQNNNPDASHATRGYTGNVYLINKTDPSYARTIVSLAKGGPWTDTVTTVDVNLVSPDSGGQYAAVYCRSGLKGGALIGYFAEIEPIGQSAYIVRLDDATTFTTLLQQSNVSAINSGSAVNHVELDCVGSTIALSVNGTQVGSVQDSTYTSGTSLLGAGVFKANLPDSVDAMFKNFVISQPAATNTTASAGS